MEENWLVVNIQSVKWNSLMEFKTIKLGVIILMRMQPRIKYNYKITYGIY